MPRVRDENSTFDETKYKREYGKANYDRITLYVPKGKRDMINAFAEYNNITVNNLIQALLDEMMVEWQVSNPRIDLEKLTREYLEERKRREEK